MWGMRDFDGVLQVLFCSSTVSLMLAGIGVKAVHVAFMVYA